MKTRTTLLALALIFVLSGCTGFNEGMSRKLDDKPKHIEFYSGGKLVKKWDSVGMVHSEANSDGYFFIDSANNKMVLVAGDLVITDK